MEMGSAQDWRIIEDHFEGLVRDCFAFKGWRFHFALSPDFVTGWILPNHTSLLWLIYLDIVRSYDAHHNVGLSDKISH